MSSLNLESLKSSGLEKRIRSSIFHKNYKVIDSYIEENIRREGDNFFIPTIQIITDINPSLEKELLDLYNRKFPIGTEDIEDEIKILQASVLDGLVVGVNTEKDGELQIYTANIGAIFGVDSNSKFNIEKTLELNRKRVVHAVRVDIDYTSEEGFNYKIVSLNKNTNLHIVDLENNTGRFHLVPYVAMQRSMAYFKEALDDMRVINVTQDKGELLKSRYITKRGDILAKYSDSEAFAKSLKPSYFPLKGFFYAPVVGASSLTMGVTRIDLIDVCKIEYVSKIENISKPEGGIDSAIKTSSIMTILSNMYDSDVEGYQKIVDNLPVDSILTGAVFDVDKGVPSPISMMKYINSLNKEDKSIIENLIPGLDKEMKSKKSVLNNYKKLDHSMYTLSEIKEMLKTGVYKFELRKKDCNYSSVTVTNSPELLKKMYGEDYFAKYESTGVRIRGLVNLISTHYTNESREKVGSWLKYCGFDTSDSSIDGVLDVMKNAKTKVEVHEQLLKLFGKSSSKSGSRKTTKRSTSNEDLILGRVALASMTTSGSVDFYRYLDMSKVISMYRLS